MIRLILLICIPVLVIAQAETTSKKTSLKKKNIIDFDDADVERLYEQWEVRDCDSTTLKQNNDNVAMFFNLRKTMKRNCQKTNYQNI